MYYTLIFKRKERPSSLTFDNLLLVIMKIAQNPAEHPAYILFVEFLQLHDCGRSTCGNPSVELAHPSRHVVNLMSLCQE